MKIVFFGTPHFVLPVLDALLKHHDVVGVVTTPDVIVGRKKILTPTPIKAHYVKQKPNGNVFTPKQLTDTTIHHLSSLTPDLFVVAAYGKIIPKEILAIPKFGSINIHPSLLPKYRGPSPIQQTILDGVTESGVTIIQMDEEIDHGPILAVENVKVKHDDTFQTLHDTMFETASTLLLRTIEQFNNGTIHPLLQDHSKATFCPHITRESGYIDLSQPPDYTTLDRMIRAYYPWPTVWGKTTIKNQDVRMKLLPKKVIQVEGKKPMQMKDFLNGYPELKDLMRTLFPNN
jgi:methionyl-tRNA formyltransferase